MLVTRTKATPGKGYFDVGCPDWFLQVFDEPQEGAFRSQYSVYSTHL